MSAISTSTSRPMDPVELCAQVHLAVSRMDPVHNTVTIVTLYRALLMELNKCSSAPKSVHVPPLLSYTHLKMAELLSKHTSNVDLALHHYSRCTELVTSNASDPAQVDPSVVENCLLATWKSQLIHTQKGNLSTAVELMVNCMNLSQTNPRWFFRLVLRIASLSCELAESSSKYSLDSCIEVLATAEKYATTIRSQYMLLLMRLHRLFLLLKQGSVDRAEEVSDESGDMVQEFAEKTKNEFHAQHIKVHYLSLHVLTKIALGKIKSSRATLKQLQDAIKVLTQSNLDGIRSKNPAEQFQWMKTEHMCILAYLITVIHHSSGGSLEKAKKYAEKALSQIEILNSSNEFTDQQDQSASSSTSTSGGGSNHSLHDQLLLKLHVMLIESAVQCDLVMGQKQLAIKKMAQVVSIGSRIENFFERFGPQIHMLLGLYSMTMNIMDNAEAQFQSVLTTATNKDLVIFAALNLSVIFLRAGTRPNETAKILSTVDPQNFPSPSEILKAAAYFLRSLHAFYTNQFQDCHMFIRETVKISNNEDISRLTTCSFVLLGHVYLMTTTNGKECCDTVCPALKMAEKVPDSHVKLWAAALLGDAIKLPGSSNIALKQSPEVVHSSVKQQLLTDFLNSSKLPEHEMIQWVHGPLPDKLKALTMTTQPSSSSAQ
ncbi:MAU2 chromatid cohesion factor homolog [Convolutriloba macropyga]|uniref:MAU2 chromatid cohesion factor homolog n=1 Tax=Convolutriloba macropyga TaxID=536237 RepID=UPI003F521FF2